MEQLDLFDRWRECIFFTRLLLHIPKYIYLLVNIERQDGNGSCSYILLTIYLPTYRLNWTTYVYYPPKPPAPAYLYSSYTTIIISFTMLLFAYKNHLKNRQWRMNHQTLLLLSVHVKKKFFNPIFDPSLHIILLLLVAFKKKSYNYYNHRFFEQPSFCWMKLSK